MKELFLISLEQMVHLLLHGRHTSFIIKASLAIAGQILISLVRINGDWKIQYLIDTRRKDNCK